MITLLYVVVILSALCSMAQSYDNSAPCTCKDEQMMNLLVQMNSTLQDTVKELELIKREKVGIPGGTVAFYAVITQYSVLGDQQTIVFDNVVTNIGQAYDGLDGQFTAPVRGLYFFSTSIMALPNHYIHAEIVHNGANLAYVFAAKGATDLADDTGTAVVNVVLQSGDKVWVRHRNDPSGDALLEGSYPTFSGFLITEGIP